MGANSAIFPHSPVKSRRALSWLPVFVILSLAAHVAALILFQIAYPDPPQVWRKSAEVYYQVDNAPGAVAFQRWLRAADPAIFSRFQTDERTAIGQDSLAYSPSFDWHQPEFYSLPKEPFRTETQVKFPGEHSRPAAVTVAPAGPPSPVRVEFSGGLRQRAFQAPAEFAWNRVGSEILDSPVFSLAVAPDGRLLYAFLEQSSGHAEADELAREFLRLGTFAPSENEHAPPVWGRATLIWPRPGTPNP